MAKISAVLLMYYVRDNKINVFLVHPGGPYFAGKDSWGVPKGEIDSKNGESKDDLLKVAVREFEEETGLTVKGINGFIHLGFLKRTGGKTVHIWAFKGSGKEKFLKSNYFELEWPAKSGQINKFPENDSGKYLEINNARKRIHKYQEGFLDRLEEKVKEEKSLQKKITQSKLIQA